MKRSFVLPTVLAGRCRPRRRARRGPRRPGHDRAPRARPRAERPFGLAGPYETLVGTVEFALDPTLRQNQAVVDLALAPRNERGEVVFTADVFILKPVDLRRGNGRVYYEVPNRGRQGDPAAAPVRRGVARPARGAGLRRRLADGQGFALAWMGWQWDVPETPGLLRLRAPIATDGGKPITGLVRSVILTDERKDRAPLGDRGHAAYPADRPRRTGQPALRPRPPSRPAAARPPEDAGASSIRRPSPSTAASSRAGSTRSSTAAATRASSAAASPPRATSSASSRASPGEANPLAGVHARARPRHLPERALPPPLPLRGLQRGRAGPARLRRRSSSRWRARGEAPSTTASPRPRGTPTSTGTSTTPATTSRSPTRPRPIPRPARRAASSTAPWRAGRSRGSSTW